MDKYEYSGGIHYCYRNKSEDQVLTEQFVFQMGGYEVEGGEDQGDGTWSITTVVNPGETKFFNVKKAFGHSHMCNIESCEAVMTLVQPVEEEAPAEGEMMAEEPPAEGEMMG